FCLRLIRKARHIFVARHVAMDGQHLAAEGADFIADRGQASIVDVGQHNIRTASSQRESGSATYPTGSTSDNRDFAVDLHPNSGMTRCARSSSTDVSSRS